MKPVAELIAVPGKSFPTLVFADGFRDLPAGTKLYVVDRDAVIEQCAKVCERIAEVQFQCPPLAKNAEGCAMDIRRLKEE